MAFKPNIGITINQNNNSAINQYDYNPNIYSSKKMFVHTLVKNIRTTGGMEFWVFNKTYFEIYYFKVTQISDFDIIIDLENALAEEHIISLSCVLHMKDKILEFLEEVPGKVYTNRFECYRELYQSLTDKFKTLKSKTIKQELLEKIEYIEDQFPELLL